VRTSSTRTCPGDRVEPPRPLSQTSNGPTFAALSDTGLSNPCSSDSGGPVLHMGPNPMREDLTVNYTVSPGARVVSLHIYDVLRQRVLSRRLADVTGTLTWDGRDDAGRPVGSGV
jgi:hypothetical protein